MKGEVYPFGIVGMANKGDCLQKGETVKFQLCVLGQNGQTMAVNITPFRRATVECVKDQVSDPGTRDGHGNHCSSWHRAAQNHLSTVTQAAVPRQIAQDSRELVW